MTESDRPEPSGKKPGETNRKKPRGSGARQKPEGGAGRRRGIWFLAAFAALVALAAAAGVAALAYLGQQRAVALSERVDTAERALESNVQDLVLPRMRELEAALEDVSQTLERRDETIAGLEDRVRQTRMQTLELMELVEGGRRRWQLREIEDLLLAANQRVQLHHDADGARRALVLADRRLVRLDDPRLLSIRERLVDEIATLDALPDPDIEGMALTLTALAERVPNLPLASGVPAEYAGGDGAAERPPAEDQPAWRHFLDSVSTALQEMLTVRHADTAHRPMIAPEQEFFLYQNLLLKLQAARLALLERRAEVFRANVETAREWLGTFFDTGDPRVTAAIERLERMQDVHIEWQAPDISGSLTALRELVEARAGSAE